MNYVLNLIFTYGFSAILIFMICTESIVLVGCPSKSSQSHINTEVQTRITEKEFYHQLENMRIDSIVITDEPDNLPSGVLDLPPSSDGKPVVKRSIRIYGLAKTDAITNATEAIKEEEKKEAKDEEVKSGGVVSEPIQKAGEAGSSIIKNLTYLWMVLLALVLCYIIFRFWRGR
jgi:preprotein translocase subunit SecF